MSSTGSRNTGPASLDTGSTGGAGARTGAPVTREMTHVSPPRVLLLVDTCVVDRTLDAHVAVERAIAMAVSLASDALGQGLSMGILAWSDGWVHVPPNRGKRHARDVLTLLARLPLNTGHDHRELLDESYRHQKSGTTLMLITPADFRLGLGDTARGNLVVLSSCNPDVQSLFTFDPKVDFTCCMPAEQQVE